MEKSRVLIVDDEPDILATLSIFLEEEGFECIEAVDGVEAIRKLESEEIDAVLLDIALPGMSGLEVLEQIKGRWRDIEVVMMTAYGTVESAVQSLKGGAFDYLSKPFDHMNKISLCLSNALERKRLHARTRQLERELKDKYKFDNLTGSSAKMLEVFSTIEKVSASTANVLVQGESGTGKELVARAIHYASPRKDSTFVVINCSALTESLLESELFGHEKGAFTGAIQRKKGLFEIGSGGTVFLDEIGTLSPHLQVKLLRVLQEGDVRRVGSTVTLRVDVRIIAATNENLPEAIKRGTFREDLYYRLNVISITLPPLRDRADDIPLLAYHFLKKYSAKADKRIRHIDDEAMDLLTGHTWIGNVRELENAIERAVVLESGDTLTPLSLPPAILNEAPADKPLLPVHTKLTYREAKRKAIEVFDHRYITELLRSCSGNISLAAQKAGMDRSNFRRIMKAGRIDPKSFKQE